MTKETDKISAGALAQETTGQIE